MECFPPSNGAEHRESHEHKQFIRGGFPSPPTTESCCEILLKSYCDGYKTAMKGFACITQGLQLISSCTHTQ